MSEIDPVTSVLECIECGETDGNGVGWRVYLDVDDDVWLYCADCAAREFGSERE